MKKIVNLVFMVTMLSALFAELVVNIPFDLDIVGDSYAEEGDYEFVSEWMIMTNTSSETQTYTFKYTTVEVPDGWSLTACNDLGVCYMPNWPIPIELEANASMNIHLSINVSSCDGFPFEITFDEGDLTEPLTYNFTFNTADNVGTEDHELANYKLQNFPNPFTGETTISFSLNTESTESAELKIYNIKGQKVEAFSNIQIINSPDQQVTWDAHNFSSGVYFYQLNVDGKSSELNKMILVK